MKLLVSEKFNLPDVYFISDREKISEIPPGVPFIFGDESIEDEIVRVMEYEIIFQEAIKTGFPFKWDKLLRENGYTDIEEFGFSHPAYVHLESDKLSPAPEYSDALELEDLSDHPSALKRFMKDSSVYVDIQKLKDLNIFPIWLKDIEEAIHTNIHNFAVFNNNMYNKKLEGMFGSLDLVSPPRNLIIIDISGSIPRGVSATCLTLAKNLAETFFADLLITGSKSTLYEYERIHELDIDQIYDENGMDNDQVYFKRLVTESERKYRTCIAFGDNHSPGWVWTNRFNKGARTISEADGKKLNKWEIEKLLSFHVENDWEIAGYATWFEPKETKKMSKWVEYLN